MILLFRPNLFVNRVLVRQPNIWHLHNTRLVKFVQYLEFGVENFISTSDIKFVLEHSQEKQFVKIELFVKNEIFVKN